MKSKLLALIVAAGLVLSIVGGAAAAQNPGGQHKDGSGGGVSPSHWAPGQFPPGQ